MRIAITGASGFVGRNLLIDMARPEVDLVPISRQVMEVPRWRPSPVLDRDTDPAEWAAVFAGIDVVVHCAARAHVMREQADDPLDTFRRINRDGAIAMAQGAARAGVRRIVFLSSVKVLGETTDGREPFRNGDPFAPLDPYAISKAEAEEVLAGLSRDLGFELVVLRPPLIYGPGVGGNIAAMIRLIRRGMVLPLGAAVRNRRSMISTINLADAIHAAVTASQAAGQSLLVSDGEDVSTRALVEGLAPATGRRARLVSIPAGIMRAMLKLIGREAIWTRLFGNLAIDITDSCMRLGWSPRHSVAAGLSHIRMQERSHD